MYTINRYAANYSDASAKVWTHVPGAGQPEAASFFRAGPLRWFSAVWLDALHPPPTSHAPRPTPHTPHYTPRKALNAGTDLSTEAAYAGGALATAISEALTNDSQVDESLTRVLTLRMRLGMFDPLEDQPYAQIPASVVAR
jgi:hypothetical protein